MFKFLDSSTLPSFKQKLVAMMPTKISQLANDTNYQTNAQVSTAITNAIAGVKTFEAVVVTELPTTGQLGVLYLKSNGASGGNVFDEFLWVSNKYEQVGKRDIDLSSYALKTSVPTKITQLTNDAGFQNAGQVTSALSTALAPYATSSSVNTKLAEYDKTTSVDTKIALCLKSSEIQAISQAEIDALF